MDKHATHCLIHLIIIYSCDNRHNKPLQASVRAVTSGTLWALKREDFRGILMSEFSNIPSLKLLRSVELFTRFTVLQLSQLAEPTVPSGRSTPRVLKQVNKDVRVGRSVVGQQNTSKVTKTVHAVRTTEVSSAISSEGHSVMVETEVTVGISVVIKEARVPNGLPTFTRPTRFELDSFDLGIDEDT